MDGKCPYCEKPLKVGSIICPACGSYTVHIEEHKRRWPKYVLILVILGLVAGVFFYLRKHAQEVEARKNEQVTATVKPAVAERNRLEEAEKARIEEKRKRLLEAKEQRARKAAREAEWKSKSQPDKIAYLKDQSRQASTRIEALKLRLESHPEGKTLGDDAEALGSKLALIETLIDADRLDQANSMVEVIVDGLDELDERAKTP